VIWQNPWAWAGLSAIALPILIHLLGRGHARVQKFPTLRFLEPSRLLPTRRTRVHDLLLLVVRVGIVALAVAALAQPLRLPADRARTLDAALARAIIVDTSASMSRQMPTPTPNGERAVDAARINAKRLGSEAASSVTIETTNPARAIAGAVAWLARQPGRTELVVVSDFQAGTLDSTDAAAIPSSIGTRFVRIDTRPSTGAMDDSSSSAGKTVVAHGTATTDRTDVEWTARAGRGDSVGMLVGAAERQRAAAAMTAARTAGVRLPLDTTHLGDVLIVTPRFEQRSAMLARASPPKQPWMVQLVARLRSEASLQREALAVAPMAADSARGLAVARDVAGRPVIAAASDTVGGRERLLLFSSADAGSVATAALIASTRRALSLAAPLSELEPSTIADNVLASWQREPASTAATRLSSNSNQGESDGRWLWAAVLVLLGVETWLRRARREVVAEQLVQSHAA
jgi:hypothetical protein